jgi:Leucine-rich repeat (LRR) protein
LFVYLPTGDTTKSLADGNLLLAFFFVELKKGFSVPLDELNLLKELYQQTHGEDWLWRPQIFGPKWNFDIPSPNPCNTNGSTWQGITCSKLPTFCSSSTSPSCSVKSLSLELYGLKGKLPYIWTEMTSLTRIALPRNRLNNSLPKELPHSLISLDLESNLLSGPIPSEYGLLTSLTSLAVERNRLRGTIPTSLGDLVNLSYLTFGYNLLSQTIPPELGQLSNLKYLTMTLCQLTGPFPSSFGSLTSLDTLDISFNSFTNSIPSTLGDMLALTSMVLDYNFFSHSIPSELTQLTGLAHLSLATNFFSGQIYLLNDNFFQLSMISLGYNLFTGPFPSFTSSPNLAKINVDTNTLSSTISSELGMLTLLNIFTINNNQFTGPIPSSFGSLLLVTQFDLSLNHLTGTIPTAFGSMANIADLQVRNNLLTGSIPSELGKLLTAQSLVLTRNLFTSTLPCTIQNLTRLSVLTCDRNYLTGICPDLVLPVSLEILDFSFNYISGSIPDRLISPLQNLLTFDGNENFFSGHLPDLSSLSIVKRINLASNHLSGSIPSFIASLSQLRQLNLGSNFFSGTLKNWLWQASNLTLVNVDLSANHLKGEISDEIFFLPFLQTLALTSNCFQGTLPESICSAEDLLVLSMDGLGSSSGCSDLITLPWSDVSLNVKKISGQIPKCLWAMKNLTTVSLSSNGLTGTLSDLLTSSLINLTLSHNHLSGTIPMSLQRHPFQSLDLSYNKFTGEYNIISSLNLQNASCRLVLEVNRLSGQFPSPPSDSSMNLYMNVLTGNIFSCVDVPDSDAYSSSYRCGSRSIDEAMIGISIVVFVASLLFVIFVITQFVSLAWMQSFVTHLFAHCHTLSSYLHPFDPKISSWDESSEELLSLSKAMRRFPEFNYFIVILFLSGIMTTLPLYLIRIGNDNYSTHSHLYRWEWTTAYLSGVLPSTLLLSAWILVVCTFLYCVKRFMWGVLSLQLPSSSFKTRLQCSQHSSSHLLPLWMSFSNDLLLLIVNIAVMGTINALYIIATNQQFSPTLILLIQVSMALFKAFWNKFCLPILDSSKQSHRLRIFVLVLNSIFIPCIVTALTSPACFQVCLSVSLLSLPGPSLPYPYLAFPSLPFPSPPFPTLTLPSPPFPSLPFPSLPYPYLTLPSPPFPSPPFPTLTLPFLSFTPRS